MAAYNRVNGEAASRQPDAARRHRCAREWGFTGYVVGDCGAVEDIYGHHKIGRDAAEAAALALQGRHRPRLRPRLPRA